MWREKSRIQLEITLLAAVEPPSIQVLGISPHGIGANAPLQYSAWGPLPIPHCFSDLGTTPHQVSAPGGPLKMKHNPLLCKRMLFSPSLGFKSLYLPNPPSHFEQNVVKKQLRTAQTKTRQTFTQFNTTELGTDMGNFMKIIFYQNTFRLNFSTYKMPWWHWTLKKLCTALYLTVTRIVSISDFTKILLQWDLHVRTFKNLKLGCLSLLESWM